MRRVLITGANSGIGAAIAHALNGRDFEVIATARRRDSLAAVPCDLRLELDVTNPASIESAIEEAQRVDILVNNAGIGVGGPTEAVPVSEAQRQFDVNFFGALRMIRAVLPQMRERRAGTIINISSLSARVPWPFGGHYGASKAALESISEALVHEVEPFGVHVILVEPGIIETDFGERFTFHDGDPAYAEGISTWAARLAGDHPGPGVVANALITALEEPKPPLRVRVGDDANTLLALRQELDDEAFGEQLKRFFGIAAPEETV